MSHQTACENTGFVATIGFFDGLHRGHRFLIDQVKEIACRKGLKSAVITFLAHPRKVVHTEHRPELLMGYEEKIKGLHQWGIDQCFTLDFTPELAAQSAYDFMRNVLKEQFGVKVLVIGYDHRFGHNRSEGFADYCRYGKELNIEVIEAKAYEHSKGGKVSSSAIRRLLRTGHIAEANVLLGYNYLIDGVVVDGYKIGRTLGFPTANIKLYNSDIMLPLDGVYAVQVEVNHRQYAGMLNIGHRPTIDNGGHRSIEVYILHFNDDIYSAPIRVIFAQYIRPEMKFANRSELINQMKADEQTVQTLWETGEFLHPSNSTHNEESH